MLEILLIVLSFILILAGLAGLILPFLPGLAMAWLGFFLFAYATNFSAIGPAAILIFSFLTILFLILDFLAPVLGAKKYKASSWGVAGSFLGVFFGIWFLGPLGIIFGPFLGSFLGEILAGRETKQAFKSAKGVLVGFLIGTTIKIALVTAMLGFMIAAIF